MPPVSLGVWSLALGALCSCLGTGLAAPSPPQAEKFELSLIQTYLPSTADEVTTRGWVEEAIAAIGATKPGDVGKVMGAVMKGHRAEVDGALVKKVAAELLSA